MITLNSRTNRLEQKVQSDLGLHCLPFHLHILGAPFVGKIDLFKLHDIVISVVWDLL